MRARARARQQQSSLSTFIYLLLGTFDAPRGALKARHGSPCRRTRTYPLWYSPPLSAVFRFRHRVPDGRTSVTALERRARGEDARIPSSLFLPSPPPPASPRAPRSEATCREPRRQLGKSATVTSLHAICRYLVRISRRCILMNTPRPSGRHQSARIVAARCAAAGFSSRGGGLANDTRRA